MSEFIKEYPHEQLICAATGAGWLLCAVVLFLVKRKEILGGMKELSQDRGEQEKDCRGPK